MNFYAVSGNGAGQKKTYEMVMENEARDPNSTLDAERMVGKVTEILRGNNIKERNLLDVGSGHGFFSESALEKGFTVTAIELAANEREIMKKMTGYDPVPVSFEDFDGTTKLFSAILMSQVLEHALDVNQWIAKASSLLVPGGVLAVALPNFDSFIRIIMRVRDPYICPPEHINFFTVKSLKILMEKHGLRPYFHNHVSRIRRDSIHRRVPGWISRLLPINCVLKLTESIGVGIMINMYAVKE